MFCKARDPTQAYVVVDAEETPHFPRLVSAGMGFETLTTGSGPTLATRSMRQVAITERSQRALKVTGRRPRKDTDPFIAGGAAHKQLFLAELGTRPHGDRYVDQSGPLAPKASGARAANVRLEGHNDAIANVDGDRRPRRNGRPSRRQPLCRRTSRWCRLIFTAR